MPNPRLAARYAKSLVDISVEKNQLETVKSDVDFLKAVINASREFKSVLKSPIITADKKSAVFNAVTAGKVSEITVAFSKLLINKGRENVLPEIVTEFENQYNKLKGINIVKFITAQPISDDLKSQIAAKLQADAGIDNIELQSEVDPSIIGGFILEYNNRLVDVSISRDLADIKKQFLDNDFVLKIR